jgi:hypothetical protein
VTGLAAADLRREDGARLVAALLLGALLSTGLERRAAHVKTSG